MVAHLSLQLGREARRGKGLFIVFKTQAGRLNAQTSAQITDGEFRQREFPVNHRLCGPVPEMAARFILKPEQPVRQYRDPIPLPFYHSTICRCRTDVPVIRK